MKTFIEYDRTLDRLVINPCREVGHCSVVVGQELVDPIATYQRRLTTSHPLRVSREQLGDLIGITPLPSGVDALFEVIIENVGNLVCPAEFDVGEHARLMVYALTEGEEKPLKYSVMFRAADAVAVNKTDLLPHLSVDLERFEANLRDVNPDAVVIHTSAKTGEGVDELAAWVRSVTPG